MAGAVAVRPHAASQVASPDTVRFSIQLRGTEVGTETVTLKHTPSEWIISSTGTLGAPFNVTTKAFELRYTADWQPVRLKLEGTASSKPLSLETSFSLTTANSEMTQGENFMTVRHNVTARTIVLPNNLYGPYEALAARLSSAPIGSSWPVYVVPQIEVTAIVNRISPQRIVTRSGPKEMRQVDLTLKSLAGEMPIELWIDAASNRMAKLVIPATSIMVVREDFSRRWWQSLRPRIAMAISRCSSRPNRSIWPPRFRFLGRAPCAGPRWCSCRDSDRRIATSTWRAFPCTGGSPRSWRTPGFSWRVTIAAASAKAAGASRHAGLDEYADDLARFIDWLSHRKDVDGNRIAVVAHGDAIATALLAASKVKRVLGVALVGAPGLTGRDTILDQQQRALAKLNLGDVERKAKLDLQVQLLDAAATDIGWENVPPTMRESADTPWFKGWVTFESVRSHRQVRSIAAGAAGKLDAEVPAGSADRLEAAGRKRIGRPVPDTEKIVVDGVNHLLVAAQTGTTEEYPSLIGEPIAPTVVTPLTTWLRRVLAVR